MHDSCLFLRSANMNDRPSFVRRLRRYGTGLAGLAMWLAVVPTSMHAAESVRVMTFNLWHGGEAGKQSLSQTAEVIRAARADIIGLQETGGFDKEKGTGRPDNGRKLAEMLRWSYFDQGERTGILSRYPIVTNTPRQGGVVIRLPSGREVRMFNVHFMHAPYQPYQLLKIPYANAPFIKTAEEAVSEARKARGGQVERLLAEMKPAIAGGQLIFLTGDFNEPSHQDWTKRAAAAGKCPLAVEYPSTLAVTAAGLRDAFRSIFTDEVARPGRTWTPTTGPEDPTDRHDRIDFVFVGGTNLTVKRCEIIGEDQKFADIVVQPYPSDHRAVVATVEIP
jgi:endonuclease/exonuclease/phosphatase family metal-dependent hydrolase